MQRAHRVVEHRALEVLSAAPMTSSPPNSGSASLDLGRQHAGGRIDAGADEVLLAVVEVLGVDAVADVDDAACTETRSSGTGPGLVDAEAASRSRRSGARPVSLSSSVPTNTTSGSAGPSHPAGTGDRPAPPDRLAAATVAGARSAAATSRAARSWTSSRGEAGGRRRRGRAVGRDGLTGWRRRARDDDDRQRRRRTRARPARPAAQARLLRGHRRQGTRRAPAATGHSARPGRSAALERRVALLEERPHGLGRVRGGEVDRLRRALLVERLLEREPDGVVEQPLRLGRAIGGPAASRAAQLVDEPSSSASGTTRLTSPMRSASAASMMSASRVSSLARCMPTRRGSTHEPPKSMVRPRRAKISENRAVSPATTRSHSRAMFIPAPAAMPRTLAIVGCGSGGGPWRRRRCGACWPARGVAGAFAHARHVGAGAEVAPGAGEHEDPVVAAGGDLAEDGEQLVPHRPVGRVLAFRAVHRHVHDPVGAFDEQRLEAHAADDTDGRGLQSLPEVPGPTGRLRARRRGRRRSPSPSSLWAFFG